MIFNRVISSIFITELPAFELFSNLSPFITKSLMGFENDSLFLLCPSSFINRRVEMIMPSWILVKVPLTALLPWPSFQPIGICHSMRYNSPSFISKLLYKLNNCPVFLNKIKSTTYSQALRSPIINVWL
jgi:hypothetical protein